MSSNTDSGNISEADKRECCLMISMGCDRETACNYLGITAEQLRIEHQQDNDFRQRLLRAEATPEFSHMRNLYNAAKDEKHWRASVWWLERRAPDRYAPRRPNSLSTAQLQKVVEELAETIVGEVADSQDRHRLLAKLVEIADSLREDSFQSHGNDQPDELERPNIDIQQGLQSSLDVESHE